VQQVPVGQRLGVLGVDLADRPNGPGAGAAGMGVDATASSARATIDRATTATANRLAAAGYPVSTTEIYVVEAQIIAADTSILTIV